MNALATATRSRGGGWLVGAAAAVALAWAGTRAPAPATLELWLLAFVLLAGLTVGALGCLMIGHLLGEIWLHPVRDELEPMARTMPLVPIFGLPLLFALPDLYPWLRGGSSGLPGAAAEYFGAPGFVARSALYLVVWTGLAALIARPGRHRGASILGLMLLLPTVGLAAIDWVASREPRWISSLYGFSFAAAQALAALGLAMLITLLRQGHPNAERLRSLTSLILSLALLTLWIWFSQFLIVWMADLPPETSWYLGRLGGGWTFIQIGVAAPALAAATVLLVPPRPGRTRILAAAGLVLVQHLAHMFWLVRPRFEAVLELWPDAILPLGLVAVWALVLRGEISRRPPTDAEYSADG